MKSRRRFVVFRIDMTGSGRRHRTLGRLYTLSRNMFGRSRYHRLDGLSSDPAVASNAAATVATTAASPIFSDNRDQLRCLGYVLTG
jgi:hypothetical protein